MPNYYRYRYSLKQSLITYEQRCIQTNKNKERKKQKNKTTIENINILEEKVDDTKGVFRRSDNTKTYL